MKQAGLGLCNVRLNIKIGRRRLYGLVNVDGVGILTVVVGLDDA